MALQLSVQLDGYDLLFVETMQANQIDAIITDDSDFTTVNGIIVFTANETALTNTKQQGRLITR